MAILNLDEYRQACEKDHIVWKGEKYFLRRLSYRDAQSFQKIVDKTDTTDPEKIEGFMAHFSEAANIPLTVLEDMTADEIIAVAAFFLECQQLNQDRYLEARK